MLEDTLGPAGGGGRAGRPVFAAPFVRVLVLQVPAGSAAAPPVVGRGGSKPGWNLRPEGALPGNGGLPLGLALAGVLRDGGDQRADRFGVDRRRSALAAARPPPCALLSDFRRVRGGAERGNRPKPGGVTKKSAGFS